MFRVILISVLLIVATSCAVTAKAVNSPVAGQISVNAGMFNGLAVYLENVFRKFKETENIDRAAQLLELKKGASQVSLHPDVLAQVSYMPKVSIHVTFPGDQCIEPDSIVRYAQESGFGQGFVVLPGDAKGFRRGVAFSRASSGKQPLRIDIVIADGRDCVDAVVIQ